VAATVSQSLRYHVDRNQKGWVKALPRIRFAIMNTVNASTGFSPFQLLMGRSPRLIPPLAPSETKNIPHMLPETKPVTALIESIAFDVMQAQDNLLAAKVAQSEFAN